MATDLSYELIESQIKEAQRKLATLNEQLAAADDWWKSNPNIEIHQFDANDRDDWLRVRNALDDRLGGSEIGTVAGLNHYTSPYALFCEKIGLVPPKDISDKEAVKQGHEFEQKVAERFEQITGKRVHEEFVIFTNKTAPHLKASIDRKVYGEESGLECKTVKDVVMRKFPQGDFPQAYYAQCASYLRVTELKRWYLAMLVFGTDFKIFCMTTIKEEADRFNYLKSKFLGSDALTDEESEEWKAKYSFLEACYYVDQGELDACEEKAAEFIGRITKFLCGDVNAWPLDEIDGAQSTTNAVKTAFKKSSPESVVTFDERFGEIGRTNDGAVYDEYKRSDLMHLCEEYAEIDDTISQLKESLKALENTIGAVMKDKEEFLLPGWKMTFKNGPQKRTGKVKVIEEYFKALGKDVPEGMITLSEPKRGVSVSRIKVKTIGGRRRKTA